MGQEFTKAVYARDVARIARRAAEETVSLAEGMWNPDFCSADATPYAVGFIEDMRRSLDWLEQRMSSARDSGSGPQGENSRSEVEGEAPQSGGAAASPKGDRP